MVQLDGEALTGASAMLISQARTALEKYSLRKGKKQIRLSDKDRQVFQMLGLLPSVLFAGRHDQSACKQLPWVVSAPTLP